MQIRQATDSDMAACQAIYAHHVLTGTGTFEEQPPSVEDIADRFAAIGRSGWAWLVAEDESGVLGYAYYRRYHPRSAYRFAAEDAIYVRDDVRGQGVGKALVSSLLPHAEQRGFRQMLAVIGDAENIASIGVHTSLGFVRTGVLRSVGFKHGRWLDVVLMQRTLGAGDTTLPVI